MTTLHDLMYSKLAQRYPTAGASLADLLEAYYTEYNGGHPFGGEEWYDRFSGPETHYADRAYRFWLDWDPVVGG